MEVRALLTQVGSSRATIGAVCLPKVQESLLEQAEKEAQMKQISDAFIDESEDLARQSMKAMRAFLTYQGDNQTYYHKAKVAAVGLTNYVRLRATENNRMMVEIAAKKNISLPD